MTSLQITLPESSRRLPLFDIALLLLLAVVIAFGLYWATRHQKVTTAEITYTVRFEDVDNEYSGALAEGKSLYTQHGSLMGIILEAKISRALEQTFDSTQAYTEGAEYSYSTVTIQGKSDVLITVKVTAEVRNGGYFVGGNRIASGMEVDAMVEGYLGQGTILTVEQAQTPASAADVSE